MPLRYFEVQKRCFVGYQDDNRMNGALIAFDLVWYGSLTLINYTLK